MRKFTLKSIIVFLAFFICFMEPGTTSAFGWGYKKNSDHQIPEIGHYKELLDQYGAYYVDDSGAKNIYLTFDNGYEQGYTADILKVLKQEKVPATFFITGHYVESEPDLVKRMVDEGHIIGNHSYHHPDFTIMNKESIKKELETLEESVAELWSNELGLIHVFWSLAFADWKIADQKGWEYAYEQIMEQMHPGAIILLHAVSSDNAQALEQVIKELKKQGYTFKSLDDLLLNDMLPNGMFGL